MAFDEFLAHNPWSKIEETEDAFEVVDPWSDSSLRLRIPKPAPADILADLDQIILLPRFTGVYHRDTRELEFIYVPLEPDDPTLAKVFIFKWDGVDHTCRYAKSSDRVLMLVRAFRPTGGDTSTEYRGLQRLSAMKTLDSFLKLPARLLEAFEKFVPASFFVGSVASADDASLAQMAKHLNFFMSYFWRESPSILIHEPPEVQTPFLPGVSSVVNIPAVISATAIDPFLLDLSLAARSGNYRLRFLYYYQILEYAAFYWTEESVKAAVRRVILNPDLHARIDEYTPKLIEALIPTRQNDEHKIRRVIETAVEPRAIWTEMQSNLACFTTATSFEGGFFLDPLVSKDTTEGSFGTMWAPKIAETFRNIRNALVHARESRTQAVIAPTAANEERLRPWVPLIRRIAEQVVLFQSQSEA